MIARYGFLLVTVVLLALIAAAWWCLGPLAATFTSAGASSGLALGNIARSTS